MPRYPALLLATMLLVTACGRDDPAGPTTREGVVRFSYTGDQTGTFEAQGEFRLVDSNTLQPGSWAVAGRDTSTELTVLAFNATTVVGDRGTLLILPLGRVPQPGAISLNCTEADCPQAGVIFNAFPLGSRSTTDALYGVTQGTVTVDTLTQTRIAGTFTGRAIRFDVNFVPDSARILTITNGRFGVPIRDNL